MICKCDKCGAAVVYNPQSGIAECSYCKSTFKPSPGEEEEREKISCSVYMCSSCGAEIVMNGVETSTYCSYCGQPTIIFSRMTSMYRPDYVIPFSVTKKKAVKILQSQLSRGFLIPDEVKHFKVEQVKGVYIPFFLYDMHYHNKMYLRGEVRRRYVAQKKYYYREAECDFQNLSIWASEYIQEDIILKLEPYRMDELKPFDVTYLSGFYSDRYSIGDLELTKAAKKRADDIFFDEVKRSVKAQEIEIVQDYPEREIKDTKYVLLPAWFLSFRYQDETYTILVNGQTGKLVGTVPYIKAKAKRLFAGLSVLLTCILAPIMALVTNLFFIGHNYGNKVKLFICLIIFILALYCYGRTIMLNMKVDLLRTKSKQTSDFISGRQDER